MRNMLVFFVLCIVYQGYSQTTSNNGGANSDMNVSKLIIPNYQNQTGVQESKKSIELGLTKSQVEDKDIVSGKDGKISKLKPDPKNLNLPISWFASSQLPILQKDTKGDYFIYVEDTITQFRFGTSFNYKADMELILNYSCNAQTSVIIKIHDFEKQTFIELGSTTLPNSLTSIYKIPLPDIEPNTRVLIEFLKTSKGSLQINSLTY